MKKIYMKKNVKDQEGKKMVMNIALLEDLGATKNERTIYFSCVNYKLNKITLRNKFKY
jgi:hypothetical protein